MTKAARAKTFCNVLAMQRGLDPVGSAGDFDDAVIVEIPLPWKKNFYEDATVLSQEVLDLLGIWLQRYHEGQGYRHRPLMVAPDPQYSKPGFRRVMFYKRPPGSFARFDKVEYLVPEDCFGTLAWALYEAPDELSRFEPYRDSAADHLRDVLVCTHGTVDAACARFGYPLYTHMRSQQANDDLRVWRVSHFGGHVYAPTIMDMPLGHYWAYVEAPQAEQIVARNGAVETLRGHYRGWAGLEYGMMQAAEREMWQREGWDWFDYRKVGIVLAQDDGEAPQWAEIRIEYSGEVGVAGVYEARVEACVSITTEHTSGKPDSYPHPQYVITWLRKRSNE